VNPILLPLSVAFRLGVACRRAAYRRGWLKTRRLSRPVVSIGNLTVGGTGKTPLAALVAKVLLQHGWKPSILTRGYARRSETDLVVVAPAPARRVDAREVGDEAALLARVLPDVPFAVCADRFRGGRAVEGQFQVDAHILDDGFQHLALARDLDLVALDATQELSDRYLLPAGRQREPLAALKRAQVVVITRAESGDPEPLEDTVAKIHPAAKVFRSSMRLLGLVDARSGEAVPGEQMRREKVTAFCGIGNPRAFFADVRRWGFNLLAEDAFPDHHVYTEQELRGLAARAQECGAAALLTTEKDAVKLPGDWRQELPVLACVIEAQILAAEEFEKTLLTHLERSKRANS
jgi:tetraacyldisaccharide 4'-kinase